MNKMEEKGNNGASIAPRKSLVKHKENKLFSLENYKCSTKYFHKKNNSLKKSLSEFLDRYGDVISQVLISLFITELTFMISGLPRGCGANTVNSLWGKLKGITC